MTLPIPSKAFEVWIRLYRRYALEPLPLQESRAGVLPIIQPITDADRLLRLPTIDTSTVEVTAVGWISMLTVPEGQRWGLGFTRAVRASGTMTHNAFRVVSPTGALMTVHEYTGTAGSELKEWLQELILDQGWTLQVFVDTHSVTGNMQMDVLFELEEAF